MKAVAFDPEAVSGAEQPADEIHVAEAAYDRIGLRERG